MAKEREGRRKRKGREEAEVEWKKEGERERDKETVRGQESEKAKYYFLKLGERGSNVFCHTRNVIRSHGPPARLTYNVRHLRTLACV